MGSALLSLAAIPDALYGAAPGGKYFRSRAILNRVKIPAGYLYTLTIVSGTDLGRIDRATEVIKKAKDFVLPEEIQAAIEGIGIGPAGLVEGQAYYDFSEHGRYVVVRILYIK